MNGTRHHALYSGSIGVIDASEGLDYPDGLYKVTQDVEWAEGGDGPIPPKPYCTDYHSSGKLKFAQFKTPYPLSEDLFLVSARTTVNNMIKSAARVLFTQPTPFKLYLMDKHGNCELLYEGGYNILHAQPLRQRVRPPARPHQVQWLGDEEDGKEIAPAVLYSADVYEGMPEEVRGKAKYLRVLEAVQRTFSTGCVDGGGSPFGSGCNEALDLWPAGGNPTANEHDVHWGDGAMLAGPATAIASVTRVKRSLGIVPVAEDGSYYFEAPPGKSLYFQLLNEDHQALHSMRSWVNLMPGEVRGCVGCHEGGSRMFDNWSTFTVSRRPDTIKVEPWGVRTLSYIGDIQPIFDRNCGTCHQGEGKARETLDLTLRPDPKTRWGGIFPEPYITLTTGDNNPPNTARLTHEPRPTIAGNFFVWSLPYQTLAPMTHWSYKSPLINMLKDGKHHDVKLSETDLRKLIVWVDSNCHFRGLEDITDINDPDPNWYSFWPNPPKLKSAPYISHLHRQDKFNSQADRPTLRSKQEK